MNRTTIKRSLILLALGGSTFALFGGTSFGPTPIGGCNYALNGDYQTMFDTSGDAFIQGVSDGVFGNIGTDYDLLVRGPTTTYAQAIWGNYLEARIPDDVADATLAIP